MLSNSVWIRSTGSAGRAGGSSLAQGEGGRGGQTGSSASQKGERDPEESHQEGEAETQDYLQGSISQKPSYVVSKLKTLTNEDLFPQQNWNYFADDEADSVKMMEEVEKLCDRLELTR